MNVAQWRRIRRFVGCDHEPFTREETCARSNLLGYMEDTVWYWNDWRDVEFRSGNFTRGRGQLSRWTTCTWAVKDQGQKVVINWGTAESTLLSYPRTDVA